MSTTKTTTHKLKPLPPRKLKRWEYRGFNIEEESADLFAVRLYHPGEPVDDFKPWCDTAKEAMKVVDKLIDFPTLRSVLNHPTGKRKK
jgi:hypothetical protein